ncbi:MAG: hypothetical protein U0166_18715 [Acidobacteriota bacterium]
MQASAPPRRFTYVGVLLTSMAVLGMQVALTRVFSFTIWYHFAYVTIGMALLGYGASGAFLACTKPPAEPASGSRLSRCAALSALTAVGALWMASIVPFHPFDLARAPAAQILWMLVLFAAVATPFFFAGLAISAALAAFPADVHRLYFFDLLGAGTGCLLVVGSLWWLGAPGTVVAAAIAAALAGIAFAASHSRRASVTAGAAALLVLGGGSAFLAFGTLRPSPEKGLHFILRDPVNNFVTFTRWTPIFRTDVYRFRDEEFARQFNYAGWGLSPGWKDQVATHAPRVRGITHDGDAVAVLYEFDGDLGKLEMFSHHILAAPYAVAREPDVLVIGVGGGADILNAIAHRARHVTGIELDPVTVDVVRRIEAPFAGHLYDRPDVTVVAGEGRSTLRHSKASYDLIQMTGVDTMAALSTGAYVLSESYLYTAEAVGELYDHLRPHGMISSVVGDFDERKGFPRHTMRELALYVRALEDRGIEDAASRIAVIASAEPTPQVACLLKRDPFTKEEVAKLQDFAARLGFSVWAMPGVPIDGLHSRYLAGDRWQRGAYLASFPLKLAAPTDDQPFFFSFYRWRNLSRSLGEIDVGHTLATGQIVLAAMLAASALLAALFVLLPLGIASRRALGGGGVAADTIFFGAIGLGFMLLEISLVQRCVLFVGYPTYALSVVLSTLLLSAGAGSLRAPAWGAIPAARPPRLLAALVPIALAHVALLPTLFSRLLGTPLPLRIAVTVAALAPLGFVLGGFFPTGIAILRERAPGLVPWAWGVNGSASVVGSVLAVVLAMSRGFRAVTIAALGLYAVAVAAMALRPRGAKLALAILPLVLASGSFAGDDVTAKDEPSPRVHAVSPRDLRIEGLGMTAKGAWYAIARAPGQDEAILFEGDLLRWKGLEDVRVTRIGFEKVELRESVGHDPLSIRPPLHRILDVPTDGRLDVPLDAIVVRSIVPDRDAPGRWACLVDVRGLHGHRLRTGDRLGDARVKAIETDRVVIARATATAPDDEVVHRVPGRP